MSEPITPAPVPAAPAIRRDGTVLGFDVGSRRIGVAIGFMLLATAALYTLCIRLLISGRGMRQ